MIPYETYKRNRDMGVQHETLAARFGDVPMQDCRARYREETLAWLSSPQVQEICDSIREELGA